MDLNQGFKEVAIDAIEDLSFYFFNEQARKNQKGLNFLYNNNIISDQDIDSALEVAVLKQARDDYETMILKRKIALDHILSPELFAYGLEMGILSDKEKKQLRFDHGEGLEIFCNNHKDQNLLSNLREKLLNPPEPVRINGDFCHDPCCSY